MSDSDYEGKGETEEELMNNLVEHARGFVVLRTKLVVLRAGESQVRTSSNIHITR